MSDQNSATPHPKMRVGVLFGGRSGEHEVSLRSAQSVMAALDPKKYEIIPIAVTKQGNWLTGENAQQLLIDPSIHPIDANQPQSAITNQLLVGSHTPLTTDIDVVFPVLHGPNGEDGTVQGLLELADLPYVGSGVVGSAVGMDKGIFKAVMQTHHLPILPYRLLLSRDWQKQPQAILNELEAALTYPMFTKPANLGSSVGISKCRNRAELQQGLQEAAQYDRRLIVEQGINARELEVSVLGNEDAIASAVGEVRPRREFYDYTAKYLLPPGSEEESELLIPAPLPAEMAERVRALAIQAYRAIDCAGMGRVDLLMDKESGELYLNEINTIPGFTSISMYPKLWEVSDLPYPKLLDRLIELAIERHKQKGHLKHTFEQ